MPSLVTLDIVNLTIGNVMNQTSIAETHLSNDTVFRYRRLCGFDNSMGRPGIKDSLGNEAISLSRSANVVIPLLGLNKRAIGVFYRSSWKTLSLLSAEQSQIPILHSSLKEE